MIDLDKELLKELMEFWNEQAQDLDLIDDFNNHPFKVIKDNSFYELVDSIKENGLLTPLVVRRKKRGKYELIAGHRRKHALEVLGILESEVEIRDLDNDEAVILMVDLQILIIL